MYLENRHLRALQTIRDSGSLARAAGRLGVTQSALSHQIKAIEQHFGIALFLRNSRPLRLTPAGQKLVALAEQVLPAISSMEEELLRLAQGESGRLHIAIECHACFDWLLPVLNRFRQIWPQVEVDLRVEMSFAPLPALQHGEIDLVISSDPVDRPDVRFDALFDYEALLVMATDHPLARKKSIHAVDLATETLVTYPVDRARLDVFSRFLQPAGIEPAAVRVAELTAVILLLVASQRGVAVLPDWVLREAPQKGNLTTRPLGDGGMHGTLYAATRRSDSELHFLQEFVALARRGPQAAPQNGNSAD